MYDDKKTDSVNALHFAEFSVYAAENLVTTAKSCNLIMYDDIIKYFFYQL